MFLLNYLQTLIPSLAPEKTKMHLARFNGSDDPLKVYIEGRFDDWQSWQTQRNFERPYVVSLIQAKHPQRWLYAGTFTTDGYLTKQVRDETGTAFYQYHLTRLASTDLYAGRMYVRSVYKERNSCLTGERLDGDLKIEEITPQPLTFGDFPGYKELQITRDELKLIIEHDLKSWKTALSTIKGIYLLTDNKEGKLYVGKASGALGVWGRWCEYFRTGHGGNIGLIQELGTADEDRLRSVTFSLLEVIDQNATEEEILRRETHWKIILLSRMTGYNRN